MDDQQQQNGAELQQQQQRPGKVQLGEFWLQAPNAWFTTADLKFEVAHITSEREPFAHAVGAMGFNELRAVLDLVKTPQQPQPAAVRGASLAPGILPGWRGAHSFLQGCVHHEAASDHSSTSDWN